jgi:hypothetical protein
VSFYYFGQTKVNGIFHPPPYLSPQVGRAIPPSFNPLNPPEKMLGARRASHSAKVFGQ